MMYYCYTKVINQKYCIAWKKDVFVADQIHWQNGDIHWDILFTGLVNDWELENLQYFLALLYSRYIEWRGEIEWHGGLLGRDLLKLNHIIESLAMEVFSPLHGEVFGR